MSTRIDELVRYELELGGGLTNDAQEAARAIRGLGQAAQASEREFDRATGAMERGLGKVGSMIGGPIADLGDVILDVRESITGAGAAIGGLGVAAAGSVAAAAALGIAVSGIADAAVDAADRLEKAGLAELVPPEATENVKAYKAAIDDLSVATDVLTVTTASGLVGALAEGATALTGAIVSFNDGRQAIVGFAGAIVDMIRNALTPQNSAVFDGFSRAIERIGTMAERVKDKIAPVTDAVGGLAEQIETVTRALLLGPLGIWDKLVAKGEATRTVIADVRGPVATAESPEEKARLDQLFSEAAAEDAARKAAGARADGVIAKGEATAAKGASEWSRAAATAQEGWDAAIVSLRETQVELEDVLKGQDAASYAATKAGWETYGAWAEVEYQMRVELPAAVQSATASFEGLESSVNKSVATAWLQHLSATGSSVAGLAEDLPSAVQQIGAMIPGIWGAIVSAFGVAMDSDRLHESAVRFVTQLADWLREMPEMVTRQMTEQVPELVGAIAQLPAAIIEGALMVPAAIVESTPTMVREIVRALGEALTAPIRDESGKAGWTGAVGGSFLLGVPITDGNDVRPSGFAAGVRHLRGRDRANTTQARQIGRAESARGMRARSGGSVGEIHVHGVTDARQFAGELRRTLGEWQLGDSLGAY